MVKNVWQFVQPFRCNISVLFWTYRQNGQMSKSTCDAIKCRINIVVSYWHAIKFARPRAVPGGNCYYLPLGYTSVCIFFHFACSFVDGQTLCHCQSVTHTHIRYARIHQVRLPVIIADLRSPSFHWMITALRNVDIMVSFVFVYCVRNIFCLFCLKRSVLWIGWRLFSYNYRVASIIRNVETVCKMRKDSLSNWRSEMPRQGVLKSTTGTRVIGKPLASRAI